MENVIENKNTTLLDHALWLATLGFHVFPVRMNGKKPAIEEFPELATRDENTIRGWWARWPNHNVGISTTRFGNDEALIVVDVDNKEGKDGEGEIFKLEMEGLEFPSTFEQKTPTGGRHLLYRHKEAVKQGTDVLGRGLDIRSRGGYVVGAGSRLEGGTYTAIPRALGLAPEWIVSRCSNRDRRKSEARLKLIVNVDQRAAEARAIEYLEKHAPPAIEGDSGDQTTFRVACQVKDFGVYQDRCLELLIDHWNERCVPPWGHEELSQKVKHAYAYGHDPVGVNSPEADFSPIPKDEKDPEKLHPFDEINKEYAYITSWGGAILHETTDHHGNFVLKYLDVSSFHTDLAAKFMVIGDQKKQISKEWIKSPRRRTYQGICFSPGKDPAPGYYNLWRGFAVKPLEGEPTEDARKGAELFLDHIKNNMCGGDEELFLWAVGYIAHIFQYPYKRPNTALFITGRRGTGKSCIFEHLSRMIGAAVAWESDAERIFGRFNRAIEGKLLVVLDEGFWSGDKKMEAKLKDQITRAQVSIEPKGREPYTVDNFARYVVMGNDEWIAPAAEDERRYAVFRMGEKKKQDHAYFGAIDRYLKRGGYEYLMKVFLEFDLSKVDVTKIPVTEALLTQKFETLSPVHRWWLNCLNEGTVLGASTEDGWPDVIGKEDFYRAFKDSSEGREKKFLIGRRTMGTHFMRQVCPSANTRFRPRGSDGRQVNCYKLPRLEIARKEFDRFMGQPVDWPPMDEADFENAPKTETTSSDDIFQ